MQRNDNPAIKLVNGIMTCVGNEEKLKAALLKYLPQLSYEDKELFFLELGERTESNGKVFDEIADFLLTNSKDIERFLAKHDPNEGER